MGASMCAGIITIVSLSVSSVFGPDIAGLIIVSTANCKTSVIGQNINDFLVIGCSAHICIYIIGFILFSILKFTNIGVIGLTVTGSNKIGLCGGVVIQKNRLNLSVLEVYVMYFIFMDDYRIRIVYRNGSK